MVDVNLIMHIGHQASLSDFRLSSIGQKHSYWNTLQDKVNFALRAEKFYWPLVRALATAARRHPKALRYTLSFSGPWIAAAKQWEPELLSAWIDVVKNPNVALACTPHHNGLTALISEAEFCADLQKQRDVLMSVFNKDALVAHNPGLIYSDHIGKMIANCGFSGCLFDGFDAIIPEGFKADRVFRHSSIPSLKLLPSHYSLSEDLNAYCQRPGSGKFGVTSDRFINWIGKIASEKSEVISAFWDLNGVGCERADTLIFISETLNALCDHQKVTLANTTDVLKRIPATSVQAPALCSYAAPAHDLTPWLGSRLQQDILEKLSAMAGTARNNVDSQETENWRKLASADLFKSLEVQFYESDDATNAAHSQINPYDHYICLRNILEDIEIKLGAHSEQLAGIPVAKRINSSTVSQSH